MSALQKQSSIYLISIRQIIILQEEKLCNKCPHSSNCPVVVINAPEKNHYLLWTIALGRDCNTMGWNYFWTKILNSCFHAPPLSKDIDEKIHTARVKKLGEISHKKTSLYIK